MQMLAPNGNSKGKSRERYEVRNSGLLPRRNDLEGVDCRVGLVPEVLDYDASHADEDDVEDEDKDMDDEEAAKLDKHQRRHRLARKLELIRKFQIAHLHQLKSYHIVDTLFTFVMGNMTFVSWVLGGVYYHRQCAKPLASFLVLMGFLTPFAAMLPILLRQWFYLHLRLNLVSLCIFLMNFFYGIWLLVGQQWAFESSPANCDADLSEATNISVFVLYMSTALYVCKVLWYLLLRVKYKYKELCLSCIRDPFPNAYRLNDEDVARLEAQVDGEDQESSPSPSVQRARAVGIKFELFHHENSIRESLRKLASVAPRPHVPHLSIPTSVQSQRAFAKVKAKFVGSKYAWTDGVDHSAEVIKQGVEDSVL